jgi:hypothetical protein
MQVGGSAGERRRMSQGAAATARGTNLQSATFHGLQPRRVEQRMWGMRYTSRLLHGAPIVELCMPVGPHPPPSPHGRPLPCPIGAPRPRLNRTFYL